MKYKLGLAIDADYLAYQAAAAASRSVAWEDGYITQYGDLNEAKEIFKNSVAALRERRKAWMAALPIMCFTDDVNWRKSVLESYKATRSGKPVVYKFLKEWIMQEYFCFERPGLEGDDIMGILSTKPAIVDCDHVIICSPDKDFNTIPGEFFWMDVKGKDHELKTVSVEDADYWHMLQTLAGDATDGYTGCPGIGMDTAAAFLQEPYMAIQVPRELKSGPRKGETVLEWKKRELAEGETLWDAIVSLFVKAGLDEAYALQQARVARILRAEDYDFKNKVPILWEPPKGEPVDVLLQDPEDA